MSDSQAPQKAWEQASVIVNKLAIVFFLHLRSLNYIVIVNPLYIDYRLLRLSIIRYVGMLFREGLK